MSIATDSAQEAFHRCTDSFFALLTPEQMQRLANLQCDAKLQGRLEVLADKANEGLLSVAERAEYEGYIEANSILSVLRAEARFRVGHGEA